MPSGFCKCHIEFTQSIWAGMEAEAVDKAFDKPSYRDQTLLKKHNAICMRCGRASELKTQVSFEKLAEKFEITSILQ